MSKTLLIQLILILAIAGLMGVMLFRHGARQEAIRRLLMLAFAGFAIVAVLFPDMLTHTAHLVGVGRGTDLLVYALVIAFLSTLVTNNLRRRRDEARLTILVRRLALDEALPPAALQSPAALDIKPALVSKPALESPAAPLAVDASRPRDAQNSTDSPTRG